MELASAANGVSEICKTLQGSEFWMQQYKQPILSLFGPVVDFKEFDQFNYVLSKVVDF